MVSLETPTFSMNISPSFSLKKKKAWLFPVGILKNNLWSGFAERRAPPPTQAEMLRFRRPMAVSPGPFWGNYSSPQRLPVEDVEVQMRKVESTTFLVSGPGAQVLGVQTPQEAQVKRVNTL